MSPMSRKKRIKTNRKIRKKAVRGERAASSRAIVNERARSNRAITSERTRSDRAKKYNTNNGIFMGIVVMVVISVFLYLFVVTSAFAEKPTLSKSAIASPSDIESMHITYVLNEIGAYKLHPYFLFGEQPVIEFLITDQNRGFITIVKNYYPTTEEGTTTGQDIIFSMTGADFVTLYSSQDIPAKTKEMIGAGLIGVDMLKSEFTLGVKGYKEIYDSISN